MSAPPSDTLRTWQARNWKDLRTIWDNLIERTPPAFRERSLTATEAGTVFERWVMEAFRLSGATGTYGYNVPRVSSDQTLEQIDGLVIDGWQGFLVEAKCQDEPIDFAPLAVLNLRVTKRPVGTLGLFFSVSGYTPPAVECIHEFQPLRVLLFDADDLRDMLRSPKSMLSLVQRRWGVAVQYGRPYPPRTQPVETF